MHRGGRARLSGMDWSGQRTTGSYSDSKLLVCTLWRGQGRRIAAMLRFGGFRSPALSAATDDHRLAGLPPLSDPSAVFRAEPQIAGCAALRAPLWKRAANLRNYAG